MKVFWFRRALQLLPGALAGLFACVVSGAGPAMAQVQLTTEKVPTFLGMDLPLRPGERVIPTASGDCSIVAFAPDETRYNRFVNYWRTATWVGACRFGLAHGNGYAAGTTGNWTMDMTMLYGHQVVQPATFQDFNYRDASGTYRRKFSNFLAGNAYSDLSIVRYTLKGFDSWSRAASMADIQADWMSDSYLQKTTYDAAGNEHIVSIVQRIVSDQCKTVHEPYKAFASEVKKACRTNTTDKELMVRTEGLSSQPTDSHRIVWAKACPKEKGYDWAQCSGLLSEAMGKDWAEMERVIAGDAAARAAAEREILTRYAPLEQAVEARLKGAGSGGQ
jgi:hypothetical protein